MSSGLSLLILPDVICPGRDVFCLSSVSLLSCVPFRTEENNLQLYSNVVQPFMYSELLIISLQAHCVASPNAIDAV